MKNQTNDLLIQTNFLTMIPISLFYCCEREFILINILMIWKKFNEPLLPEKEDFYSHLNMDDITDTGYAHAKKVCKEFEI